MKISGVYLIATHKKEKAYLQINFLQLLTGQLLTLLKKKTTYKSFTYTTYGTVTYYNKITIC